MQTKSGELYENAYLHVFTGCAISLPRGCPVVSICSTLATKPLTRNATLTLVLIFMPSCSSPSSFSCSNLSSCSASLSRRSWNDVQTLLTRFFGVLLMLRKSRCRGGRGTSCRSTDAFLWYAELSRTPYSGCVCNTACRRLVGRFSHELLLARAHHLLNVHGTSCRSALGRFFHELLVARST